MEKIKKNAALIGKVLKVLRGLVSAAGCVAAVFAVLAVFVPLDKLMDTAEMSLTLGILKLSYIPDTIPESARFVLVFTLLSAVVTMAGLWFILGILGKIMDSMAAGRPFGGAESVRKLAWSVLVFGIISSILESISAALQFTALRIPDLFEGTKFFGVSLVTEFDMSCIAGFAVLMLLSYVFRYGEELQQQDDETL